MTFKSFCIIENRNEFRFSSIFIASISICYNVIREKRGCGEIMTRKTERDRHSNIRSIVFELLKMVAVSKRLVE